MTIAYRVPFRVDRTDVPHYRLINTSHEQLTGLRIMLLGPGTMLRLSTLRVSPGASVIVTVRGRDLARSSVLIVRWFRPNGDEYLWRVSF
jgi:hypothetical protein